MAVAAPGNPRLGPLSERLPLTINVRYVATDAPGQMLDDRAHLFAFGRLAPAQDHRHRFTALDMIDVHRLETAAIVMGVPEGQLLTAMYLIDGVVDIERHRLGRSRKAGAELIRERRRQTRCLDFRRHVLQPAHRRLRA